MKASYRWLCELSGVDAPASDVAERLTRAGLEVEGRERFGAGLDRVVVAEVRTAEKVPDKDKLTLVTVFDGSGERKVICGAPNVPRRGGRVVLALPGAKLPNGMEIAERSVGGVKSAGMLCSETELGIGTSGEGILVLGPTERGKAGQPIVSALELDDTVFEISLTPNRPDCLGHIGLAREVAIAFGAAFRTPDPGHPSRMMMGTAGDAADELALLGDRNESPVETITLVDPMAGRPTMIPIRVEAPDRCPRYAGGVMHHVRVAPSPFWARYRLHVLGLRAIDSVVDATNLVLYEAGHPIHAFDLARLNGPEIVVRLAKDGERMKTLDGVERLLTADDLLICDGAVPVALAGVMGGQDSEIRADTTSVLIEVAYFDPRSIRRTSRRLGIHTDSSHRFERGVDPNGVAYAMRRAAALIGAHADGAAAPCARDIYPKHIPERQIALAPRHVSSLLGMPVRDADARTALEGIGCAISPGEKDGWRVNAPTWRPDLARPEDLIEEVARVRGYELVPSEIPRVVPSGRGMSPRMRAARRLREAAADLGLLEAVNFAFVSRAALAKARAPSDAVALANPISEERTVMRTSLLPGLLEDIARTRSHDARGVALFELARTYHPRASEKLPHEKLELAIALAGPRVDHVGAGGMYDFYDAKGAVESLLQGALGISIEAVAAETPYLHPRRCAVLRVGDREIGVLGEVHPDVSEAFDLDVRVAYAALDVDALLVERTLPKASPLPRFPAVARDVALVVGEAIEARAVERVLRAAGAPLAEAVELFDVYRGRGIVDGHKSLAYRIVYRDPEATLTDRRVDQAHAAVIAAARAELGASVRE